jgi:hypothetical protein
MSLGIAVHNVIENLKTFKTDDRVEKIKNLEDDFNIEWEKYTGKIGGFKNEEERDEFKKRGVEMIKNVITDPKILLKKTIPLSSYYDGDMLPNYYISEEENIILCGNLDWIEYKEDTKTLELVDFKTGKNEEKEDSVQLPIYKLLLENLQNKWKVANGKYWYLESGVVTEKELSSKLLQEVKDKIINTGVEIRNKRYEWSEKARFNKPGWLERKDMVDNFKCPQDISNYCDCKKYEKIINGDPSVEYVGVDMYGKDSYFINK